MEEKDLKKLIKKYKFLKKKTLPLGIECGVGWNALISDLFKSLADANPPDNFLVIKVFSKMNELKLHTKNGNNTTRFLIDEFVEKSSEICEFCGNNIDLQQCDKCKDSAPVVETDIEAILHPEAAALAAAAAAATATTPAPVTTPITPSATPAAPGTTAPTPTTTNNTP